jgi:phosphoglycerol transferase MdoB-like AlkP superfamily enzyme
MDLLYSFQEMKQYVLLAVLAFLAVLGCTHVSFRPQCAVNIPISLFPLLLASELLIGFTFIQDKVDVLYPFRHRPIDGPSVADRILDTFQRELTVKARNAKLKNLVLFEVESMDLAYIGKFNREYPLSMPWLTEVTERYTYFTNFVSQPYTTWSAAGMAVTQRSLPLVVSDVDWSVRSGGQYAGFDRVACIPNILSQLGYHLFAYCTGDCTIMQMKGFMAKKGYRVLDSAEHNKADDADLFEWLGSSVLPKLTDPSQSPFALLILNADTHPPFFIGGRCNDYLREHHYPQGYRSFTCLDQRLERFMITFKELGLDKNAEVVIYGDHLTMGDMRSLIHGERNLSMFMPLRLHDSKWRRAQFARTMSYYDIAPTIMDLLGIDYSPRFPFGESLFGEKEGKIPTIVDLQFIYQMILRARHGEATCHGRPGMCRGNEA